MPPKKNKQTCNHCRKTGHVIGECWSLHGKGNKNNNKNNNNGNNNNSTNKNGNNYNNDNRQCIFCGHNDHWAVNCTNKQETGTGGSSGFLMAAPWQVAPPQLEALWCKWCNTCLHSTAGCQNTNTQVQVMVMPESKDYRCDRCGYKGHLSKDCCNPYPDQKCLFCQRPGHAFQDCVRRDEPRVRDMLASLPARQSNPVVKKDEPSQNMSNIISTFKRRREALDQSQQAANSFIANLVNATSNRETQDIVPVRPHELVHIMDGVLAWEQGDNCTLWGQDLTETVKAMRMYHLSEGVNFFRIFYAIRRLEAGFNVNCAHTGCKGNALIITPVFQTVNVSTRSGYPRDQPEHAVFLASSCSHPEFSFEWSRSRIEEGDLTPLYLLQAAHANPIFNQFTQLKAGIATRDLDLEYDAMLELEKQRQALDAEQEKIADASTKLRLQELVFRRHAELLGSPMDWKAPTPITNKFLPPSSPFSPFSPRKRPWGDIMMEDPPTPRYDRKPAVVAQSSPTRTRFDESKSAQQYSDSTPQTFYPPAPQSFKPEDNKNDGGNNRGGQYQRAGSDTRARGTNNPPRGDRGGRGGRGGQRGRGTPRGGQGWENGPSVPGKRDNQKIKNKERRASKEKKRAGRGAGQQNNHGTPGISPNYEGNNPRENYRPGQARDGNEGGEQDNNQGNYNGGQAGGSGGGGPSGPSPLSQDKDDYIE